MGFKSGTRSSIFQLSLGNDRATGIMTAVLCAEWIYSKIQKYTINELIYNKIQKGTPNIEADWIWKMTVTKKLYIRWIYKTLTSTTFIKNSDHNESWYNVFYAHLQCAVNFFWTLGPYRYHPFTLYPWFFWRATIQDSGSDSYAYII